MVDYKAGLFLANAIFLGSAALIILVLLGDALKRVLYTIENAKKNEFNFIFDIAIKVLLDLINVILGVILPPALIFLAAWSGLYVVCNTFIVYKPDWNSALHAELSSGTIGLRLVSILLTFRSVSSFFQLISSGDKAHKNGISPEFSSIAGEQSAYQASDLKLVLLVQVMFYNLIVSGIWYLIIHQQASGFYVQILNWSLFYIVDYWVLISDFMLATKGQSLLSHRIRIVYF